MNTQKNKNCPNIEKQDQAANFNWSYHREQTIDLLKKGLWGFIPGLLLGVLGIALTDSEGPSGFADLMSLFLLPFMVGFVLMGVPYGWELVNELIGNWYPSGSILFVIFFYFCKFAFAYMIGVLTFPFVLIYHAVMSLKTKRQVVISVATLIILVFSGIYLFSTLLSQENAVNHTEISSKVTEPTKTPQIVSIDSFSSNEAVLTELCQKALAIHQQKELEVLNYGWTVPESTQVRSVYYLESKDPDEPHRHILKKLNISNAVVVVTGYYLTEAAGGFIVNEWEMQSHVFPNFFYDELGALSHDMETDHYDSVRSEDMEDFMDWFSSAFSDMNITELPIPKSVNAD